MGPPTYLLDLDGTLFIHGGTIDNIIYGNIEVIEGTREKINQWRQGGACIVLITARPKRYRCETEILLRRHHIIYDELIMGVTNGVRVLVNDMKNGDTVETAIAVNLKRDTGINNIGNF